MEKSHVSLDTKVCILCNKHFEVGVLLDRKLKNSLERNTITGVALCPECTKEGFTLLIEVDPDKSVIENNRMKPQNAYKTGRNIYIKNELFEQMFHSDSNIPFCFITETIFNDIKKLYKSIEENGKSNETEL